MDEIIEEASKKYQGLVPLVYDIETMGLDEARPQDMPYAVYLKREADKVIAEKDKEIARLDDLAHAHNIELLRKENLIAELKSLKQALMADDLRYRYRIRRHKYKRCLYMAKWCFTKSNYHFVLARHGEYVKENNRKSFLYSKWHNRWLAIAEKFKEGK